MTTKNYLTTEQFIKVFESLSDEKKTELGAVHGDVPYGKWGETWSEARDMAWSDAKDAETALRLKDLISAEIFLALTRPWTSCNLSLYAEDWADVLGVTE